MKKITLIFWLGWISIFGQSTQNSDFSVSCLRFQNKVDEKPIVNEWVKMDADRIEEVFNKIPSYGSSIDSLKLILPNLQTGKGNSTLSIDDLGQDLELLRYTLYGGYGSLKFEILNFKGKVLRINQYISNHTDLLKNRFLPLVKVPLTCINGDAENETYYPRNINEYRKFHHFFLDSLTGDDDDIKALKFFTDYSYTREYRQYPMTVMDSYWKPAFSHIRHLVQNKKFSLLEKLLYSPIQEGRLFSASALNYSRLKNEYKPSDIVISRIAEIEKSETKIASGILSCWIGKFEYDYYDVYNDFEKLLTEI